VSINTGKVGGSLCKLTKIDRVQTEEEMDGRWVHKQINQGPHCCITSIMEHIVNKDIIMRNSNFKQQPSIYLNKCIG
jgi:hypothetical protein